jgi:glutathione peroxidase-family protein
VFYPEEWDWTLDKQILKNLDSQYKAIDKINQSLKDFITLHHPCGRYLVTSIRNLLQVSSFFYMHFRSDFPFLFVLDDFLGKNS